MGVRASTFNMAVPQDITRYEEIMTCIFEGEDGWGLIKEKEFQTEEGTLMIYAKWYEPDSDG